MAFAPESGYISKYLTHFVGGQKKETPHKDQNTQFNLLCNIIKGGNLYPGGKKKNNAGDAKIDFGKRFSSNECLLANVVCFCDIPVKPNMLAGHTKVYSKFGIAFKKEWLAGQGANPVLYLAKSSNCTDHTYAKSCGKCHPCRVRPREMFFDEVTTEWLCAFSQDELRPDTKNLRRMNNLIFWYLLCYCKFFDETLDKDDPEYLYKEREWRTIGGLGFCQENIAGVIVPDKSYKDEFIEEFPDFAERVRTLEN